MKRFEKFEDKGEMTTINLKYKKCNHHFNFETGKITFGKILSFEKEINCPKCGKVEMNDFGLTELGQTQVAEMYYVKTK